MAVVHHCAMSETVTGASGKVRDTETRDQHDADRWASFAADSLAEMVLLHTGVVDLEHRAKVREAQERALAKGSDFI